MLLLFLRRRRVGMLTSWRHVSRAGLGPLILLTFQCHRGARLCAAATASPNGTVLCVYCYAICAFLLLCAASAVSLSISIYTKVYEWAVRAICYANVYASCLQASLPLASISPCCCSLYYCVLMLLACNRASLVVIVDEIFSSSCRSRSRFRRCESPLSSSC